MKTFSEFMNEEFSQGMKDWMKNNDITRKMQAREPAEAPSKPTFDRAAFDAKMADMKKKIDAEGPFITNKQSQSVHWDDKIADRVNRINNRISAPKTVKPEPVDFTGSRHSDGKTVEMPKPVDFTGSRHSDGKTVSVRDQITVTPDKPLVGKSDSIGKLLAAKGYDRSGKKIVKPTAQTRVATRPETPEVPVKKTQTAVPIPKARPSNLKPAKPAQTFKQAFANAPEGSKFNWTDPKTGKTGTYLRKTKKTRR